jgi:uncharacterized membrane protein
MDYHKNNFRMKAIDKWLLVASAFAVMLLIARITITGKTVFKFLPWNLFLAYVPYAISTWIEKKPGRIINKWKFALVFATWILFLPNSFYILTDLFHLQVREESSRWFDLTLILSFAWCGLLMGILSVRQMEKAVASFFHPRKDYIFLLPVMGMNALGIYIGRFMRFNSWDVLTNPFSLLDDTIDMLLHPVYHLHNWGMIACFAVFMTIIYLSAKHIGKAT